MKIDFRAFTSEVEKQSSVGDVAKAGFTSGIKAHHLDRAGLAMLAAPAVKHLATGKDMSDKNKSRTELAGLGTLGLSTLSRFKHASAMAKVAAKLKAADMSESFQPSNKAVDYMQQAAHARVHMQPKATGPKNFVSGGGKMAPLGKVVNGAKPASFLNKAVSMLGHK